MSVKPEVSAKPDTPADHDVLGSPGVVAGADAARRGQTSAQRSSLPVLPPLAGIVELAVITAVLVAFDWALPEFDLADVQPHPFWIPVLLLSLQYGTVSGLMAATVALLVTVAAGLPPEVVGENHFNYALRVYAQPILWFAAALLLGQFRMRQIEAKQGLYAAVSELGEQRAALARYAESLRRRCDMLELDRAAMIETPSVHAVAALHQLGRSQEPTAEPLPDAFARCIAATFGRAEASVFLAGPEGLRLLASAGWQETGRWQTELSHAHPLCRAVLDEAATLSVLTPGDENRLAGQGLAVVPLWPRAGGDRPIGLVKLERVEPDALNAATVPALRAIAEAVAVRVEASAHTAADAAAAKLVQRLPPRSRSAV